MKINDKTVLITGGTTGLGFELMQQLLEQNCSVAICARTLENLHQIKKEFPRVLTIQCDVSNEEEVQKMIKNAIDHFGKIDLLINNAGIIMVGPMEAFTLEHYHKAMDVMYWGIVHTTLAILPHMKRNNDGHIVNITSIGGKVSVPYLLPYSAAKFAAVGFSEGMAIELRKYNINVTTVVPGLMRTGSYINALFQKDHRLMFKLFAAASTAPFLTITAKKAARLTLRGIKNKNTLKVLGMPAKLLIMIHHYFPEKLNRIMSITSRFLPGSKNEHEFVQGKEIKEKFQNTEFQIFKPFARLARNLQVSETL